MASKCSRIFTKASIKSIKSAIKIKPCAPSPTPSINRSTSSPLPTSSPSTTRFTFSRLPAELGGVQSMLPLHSAVATARMTSCLSLTSRRCAALLQEMGLSTPR